MSFHFVFLLSSYLLVFLGLVGLSFTEDISSPHLLVAWASFGLGLLGERRGGKAFLPGIMANLAMLVVFALTLFSILVLQALPVQELVHFLLALQAVKLLSSKSGRDWLQLYLLSFFSLIAASALSVELFFAVVFVCYLVSAPWTLMLFHLKQALVTAGKDPEREAQLVSPTLLRLVAGIDAVLFSLTLVFFVTFPRFGAGFFGKSWASGVALTGFSDRLALGEVAEIQKNNAVAMRVAVDQPDLLGGRELYWRGVALDLFDGRRWLKSSSDLAPLKRIGDTYVVSEREEVAAPFIRQKIFLEPTGSAALFALDRPVAISGRLYNLFRDPLGNLRTPYPFPFQISYEAVSSLRSSFRNEPSTRSFLQLPKIDPRIAELSQRLTEENTDALTKAQILEQYLRRNYRYSLQGLPASEGDPLAVFLFDLRQGNCEYFASALAVMLRGLGIPTRVVNGYRGGEWNPYGQYYLIRHANAHSWVEAYIAGRGWVTLDPTPPNPSLARVDFFGSVNHLVDFLRMRWYRYVINFSLGDQYQLFTTLRHPNTWFDLRFRGLSLDDLRQWTPSGSGPWVAAGLLFAGLALGWNVLKRMAWRGPRSHGAASQAAERYRLFLAILKRKKLTKRAGETPDEFSQRAEPAGRGPIGEFTSLYQEARFSGHSDFSAGLEKMDWILTELRKTKIQTSRPSAPHVSRNHPAAG